MNKQNAPVDIDDCNMPLACIVYNSLTPILHQFHHRLRQLFLLFQLSDNNDSMSTLTSSSCVAHVLAITTREYRAALVL